MAETKKNVVVCDPNAPIWLYVTPTKRYYGGVEMDPIQGDKIDGDIIIPSDELCQVENSVYNLILTGDLKYNGRGSKKINKDRECIPVVKKYLSDNKDKYEATIVDARSLVGKLFYALSGYKPEKTEVLDKLFHKFGFVKVYTELKANEDEINEKVRTVNIDLTEALEQNPRVKDEVDNVMISIIDKMENNGAGIVFDNQNIIAKTIRSILENAGIDYQKYATQTMYAHGADSEAEEIKEEPIFQNLLEMAETKKNVVVCDPNAPMCLHITPTERYYGGVEMYPIPEDKIKGDIVIPSDELYRVEDSVYSLILSGDLDYSGEGTKKINKDCHCFPVVKEYLADNKDKYEATIADARSLVGKLFYTLLGYKPEKTEILDKLFHKFGFVKVYTELKENEDEINEKVKTAYVDLTDILEQNPKVRNKVDSAIISIIDTIKTDDGKPIIDKNNQRIIIDKIFSILKDAGIEYQKHANQPMPVYGVTDISENQKAKFISQNPLLNIIENRLRPNLKSRYRRDNHFIYVDIYDSINTQTKTISMTVDLYGRVFNKAPKFWPCFDCGEPVDFKPALYFADEVVTKYLQGSNNFAEDDYCMTKQLAELNRCLELISVTELIPSGEEEKEVIETIRKAIESVPEIKETLKKRRLVMTQYKDNSHFILETPANVQEYCGGPNINTQNTGFIFSGSDPIRKQEFMICSDTFNTALDMEKVIPFL